MKSLKARLFSIGLKNERGDALIYALFFLLLAGTGLFYIYLKKHTNAKRAESDPFAVSSPATGTGAATGGVAGGAGPGVSETKVCARKDAEVKVGVHLRDVSNFNAGQMTTMLMRPDLCVRRDGKPLAVRITRNVHNELQAFFLSSGAIEITAIHDFNPSEIPIADLLREDPDFVGHEIMAREKIQEFAKQFPADLQKFAVITFKVVSQIQPTPNESPAYVSFAENASAEELERLSNSGAAIIDLRSPPEFASHHFPSGVNIPYSLVDTNSFSKLQTFEKVDKFDIGKLPKPKTRKLVFIGKSNSDFAPMRAALSARANGWKDLVLIRRGEAERLELMKKVAHKPGNAQ